MGANHLRVVSGVLLTTAATGTLLLTAACSGTATVASGGSTTSVHWSQVQGGATTQTTIPSGGNTQQTNGNHPVSQPKLLFPTTSFTASIDGYDSSTHMISFHVVDFRPGGPDDGTFVPDPNRPDSYRLPVTDSARITGRLSLCPGIDEPMSVGVSCGTKDLEQQLQSGHRAYADVHVDAADHIDVVDERYHP